MRLRTYPSSENLATEGAKRLRPKTYVEDLLGFWHENPHKRKPTMPLTKKEAAEFLGVSPRTIEGYAAKGKLTPGKAKGTRGDITVYDEQELERLKEERGQIVFLERPQDEKPTSENLALTRTAPLESLELWQGIAEAIRESRTRPQVNVGEKIVLTLADASALTSLSTGHLREAIHTGKLKAKIIGRGYKIKRADLDAYVKKL
jgi:excisionase family DNA binding protein